MRLPQPFYRLPVRFDTERLLEEVLALPVTAWHAHPNEIPGNSSVRLISARGGESDAVNGRMEATPHLRHCPYIRQVLSSFGVVWGRSRLMRLAPHASVPQHADINYHWFNRVRLHIPILTLPPVRFSCDGTTVHMAAGEAWLFDNWRLHSVENPTDQQRIHLVADTTGSSSFWHFVGASQSSVTGLEEVVPYDQTKDASPMTEQITLPAVMPPAEVDLLTLDLRSELLAQEASTENSTKLLQYHSMLDILCKDWRQLYLLHGDNEAGWTEFARLRDSIRERSRLLTPNLTTRTNRVSAHNVLEGRLLRPMLTRAASANAPVLRREEQAALRRPVFIVAAPRSGSTLLFETLASSEQFFTLGGEAHWLVEEIEDLQPLAPGVDSNRLTQSHADGKIARRIRAQILECAVDQSGRPIDGMHGRRFLEKTPKNALRIPFFDKVFPDAQFIFLWREPAESLGSIIDAWNSGKWKTYNGLQGFSGPWSLLLPPGWQEMDGKSIDEIAAFQWESVNRIILDDFSAIPRSRWTALRYADFVEDPRASVRRLCEFTGIPLSGGLLDRVENPLPLSRFTLTPPDPDKWKRHGSAVNRLLPQLVETRRRLQDLR